MGRRLFVFIGFLLIFWRFISFLYRLMSRFMFGLLEILVIVLLFILGNVLDFIFGFGTMNRIVTDFGKFDGFIIIRFNFVMI